MTDEKKGPMTPPSTLDEAMELYNQSLKDLDKSEGETLTQDLTSRLPSGLNEDEQEYLATLPDLQRRKEAQRMLQDRMPASSQEALDKFDPVDQETIDDEDGVSSADDSPDPQTDQLYNMYESHVNKIEGDSNKEYVQELQRQLQETQNSLYQSQQYLKNLQEQNIKYNNERHDAQEYDLKQRMNDAIQDGDSVAQVRLQAEMMNHMIQRHNEAMLMAQQQVGGYGSPPPYGYMPQQMLTVPTMQGYPANQGGYVPQQPQYVPPQTAHPYFQNIAGYNTHSYPVNAVSPHLQETVASPSPSVPKAPRQTSAAPSRSRSGEVKAKTFDPRAASLVDSIPIKIDGKELSRQEKLAQFNII